MKWFCLISAIGHALTTTLALAPFYGVKIIPFLSVLGMAILCEILLYWSLRFNCWAHMLRSLPSSSRTGSLFPSDGRKGCTPEHTAGVLIASHVSVLIQELNIYVESLLGLLQTLLSACASAERQAPFVDAVGPLHSTIIGLSQLLRDFSDLCCCEEHTLSLSEKPFVLTELVDSLRLSFDDLGSRHKIGFEIVVHSYRVPETLHSDYSRLKQVVSRLLFDAFEELVNAEKDGLDMELICPKRVTLTVDTNTQQNRLKFAILYRRPQLLIARVSTTTNTSTESGGFLVKMGQPQGSIARSLHHHLLSLLKCKVDVSENPFSGTLLELSLPIPASTPRPLTRPPRSAVLDAVIFDPLRRLSSSCPKRTDPEDQEEDANQLSSSPQQLVSPQSSVLSLPGSSFYPSAPTTGSNLCIIPTIELSPGSPRRSGSSPQSPLPPCIPHTSSTSSNGSSGDVDGGESGFPVPSSEAPPPPQQQQNGETGGGESRLSQRSYHFPPLPPNLEDSTGEKNNPV